MKMIGHDHFICHSYCHFSVLSHILLSDKATLETAAKTFDELTGVLGLLYRSEEHTLNSSHIL